ncbi:MSIR6 protein, partial [Acromyrmex insinuator]
MVTRTKKIFVGGLSAPTTLEDVKNYFEQFGPVSIKTYVIITLPLIVKLKLLNSTDFV